MTEDEAIKEVLNMSEHDLNNMTHENAYWNCCIEGCMHKTKVKDYGIYPFFRWRKKWEDISKMIFYCGNHWKIFKRNPESLTYRPMHQFEQITYQTKDPEGQ